MIEHNKHRVEFAHEGEIHIREDESILKASLAAGIPHFHACGGHAKCSTCRVLVLEGAEKLTPPNEKEAFLNNQMHFPRNVRLACQTHVVGGPVKLRRIIRDESDIDLYIGSAAGISTQQMGEEAELVLFFLDIRDFTALVGSRLPFDVIHIIRKLFSVFQTIIEHNEGRILETAGDGLYAIFGSKSDKAGMAKSAVQSAYAILAELYTLNETYFRPHFEELIQVGIGIHIGKVVSGTVRIGQEDRTVVMGYPVNIASRLQNATKEVNNSLIVSSDIYSLLQHSSSQVQPISIQVKGISTPLSVYLLGKPYEVVARRK